MERRESTRSLRRCVELLELFERHRRPLGSAEISKALEAPRSSTASLLRNLVDLGLLIVDRRTATYLPSTYLAALTNWVGHALMPEGDLLDRLVAICDDARGTIALWTAVDLQMEILHVVEGTTPALSWQRAGQRFPILSCAAGMAHLLSLPSSSRSMLLRRIRAHTARSGHDFKGRRQRRLIAEALARGYAMRESQFVSNALSVAVPTRRHGRRPQLIVSLDAPATRLSADDGRIIRAFRELVARWEESPQAEKGAPVPPDVPHAPDVPHVGSLRQGQPQVPAEI